MHFLTEFIYLNLELFTLKCYTDDDFMVCMAFRVVVRPLFLSHSFSSVSFCFFCPSILLLSLVSPCHACSRYISHSHCLIHTPHKKAEKAPYWIQQRTDACVWRYSSRGCSAIGLHWKCIF